MKTIKLLLSMMIALIVASCTSNQKVTTTPCQDKNNDTIAFYRAKEKTFTIHFDEDCFQDSTYNQEVKRVENGRVTGTLSKKTKGYFKKQEVSYCDFKVIQTANIFSEVENSDNTGQIGASVEGKNLRLRDNDGRTLTTKYYFVAVFTTDEKTDDSFTGNLYQFHSTLVHKDTIPCLSEYEDDGRNVPIVFVPAEEDYKEMYLHKEELELQRIITDTTDYYAEKSTFTGNYRALKEKRDVQQSTMIGGIEVVGPKEEVSIYALTDWRIEYTKTDIYESSKVFVNGFLKKNYYYNVTKGVLLKDENANGHVDFVVVDGKEMTLEEYKQY